MIDVVLRGMLFGGILAVMLGPVFFALIQNSISKGFKAGISMALGIAVSDSSYIVLMFFSVKLFKNNDTVSIWLGIIGGIIMLITGILSIRKKFQPKEVEMTGFRTGFIRQFIKGFALNGINPFVLLYWLGVMTLVTNSYHYDQSEIIVFFCAIIGTLIITDLSKVALSHRLRNWVTPKRMNILNKVVGIALILFSFRLFYFAIEHY